MSGGEDLLLYAYELAEHYGQDPAVFRRKALSDLVADIRWTMKLADRRAEAQSQG